MANYLGLMAVKLGADYASLQSDLGKAAHINSRYADDIAAKWNNVGAKIGAGIGIAAAAAVTGLVVMTKAAIDNADAMSNMAQKIGIGTEALSALAYQASLADVELGSLQTGLTKFSKLIAEAAGGDKGANSFFKAINVDIKDLAGNLLPTEKILADTADRFASYEDGAAKTALAVKGLGKAGADLIPFLNEGADGMARAAKEAAAFGNVVSEAGGKAADEFNDNLDKIRAASGGLFNQISERLTPALAVMSGEMVKGATQGEAMAKVADAIATALKGVITGLVYIKNGLEVAAAQFTGFVLGAKALFSGVGEYAKAAGAYIGEQIKAAFTLDPAMADKSAAIFADRMKKIGATVTHELAIASKLTRKSVDDQMRDIEVAMRAIWSGPGANAGSDAGGGRGRTQAPVIPDTSGADKAAADAKKLAADIERLGESAEEAMSRLGALGASFTEFADPMAEADAKLAEAMDQLARATQEANDAIDARAAKDGDAVTAANQHAVVRAQEAMAAEAATAAYEASVAAIQKSRDITALYVEELSDQIRLSGMSAQKQQVEATVMRALADAKKLNVAAGKEVAKVDEQRIRQLAQLQEAMAAAANINAKSPLFEMADQAKEMGEAIKTAIEEGMDPELIKPMEDALKKLKSQITVDTLGGFKALLGAIQTFTKEGSSGFKNIEKGMAALSIIQDIIALKAAVSAVLTQGQGDPYSAFARMAAMAAAVAPFLASIGQTLASFGGGSSSGGSSGSEARQAAQGTGSILGDSEAKSESMVNAMEITAEATSQLPALSRGMLNALQSMQAGISGASAGIARVEFGDLSLDEGMGMNSFLNPLGVSGTIGGRLVTSIFGGDQDLIDQGIRIVGGTLNDMINNIMASAYQTVETNGGWFGSDDIDDEFQALSERTTTQLRLVLQSISDAVSEGAEALGLNMDEVNAAIAAFRIEEIRISTMDLTGEEAQAELEAVFSTIFDDLAGAVVPFVEQFQRVGEGLGETLVRVATGVQVTREAMRYLGIAIDEADPERFAQISEGLIDAVGGIDAMIAGMQSFVSNFATDAHRLQVATTELNDAFAQAGLTVPATAEGMWALMQTFDATTEEGREQIATLLRLSDTARQYYDLIEKAEEARLEYAFKAAELRSELGVGSDFITGRAEIEQWTSQTIKALNDLARAAGRAGASEQDLVNVHQVAAQRVAQLIKMLREQASDLAVQLGYITQGDTLESLNAQIASLSQGSADAAGAIGDAVDSMREKMNLLLGDLSPFNDQKKLELALQGLREGSVDPQQVLEIGRRLYASTSNYTALFEQVMGMARFGTPNNDVTSDPAASGDGRTLAQLIAERDAMLEAQRPQIADQLARRIAELSYATGEEFAEIAENMGWTLDRLADDLGFSDEVLAKYLEDLRTQFEAQDFSNVGTMIADAIDVSRDAIVAAIQGKPVEDIINAADERMAEQEAQRAAGQDAITAQLEGVNARLDSLASTIVSSDRQSDDRISGALNEATLEAREGRLLSTGSGLHTLRSVGSVLSR